jgi:hypothetical protein
MPKTVKPSMTNSVPVIPELSRMRTEATSVPLHVKQKELKKQLNWQCGRLPEKPSVARAKLLLIQ